VLVASIQAGSGQSRRCLRRTARRHHRPPPNTEADTRANPIDPLRRDAGWGVAEGAQDQRELICPGRILCGGQRGTALSVDYVLRYRGR